MKTNKIRRNPEIDGRDSFTTDNTGEDVKHDALGKEKRDTWKTKFSRIISVFHQGSTYKRDKGGAKQILCRIRKQGSKTIMLEATGFRMGKWGAEGSAKRHALRKLKKALGKRFNTANYTFEYIVKE